MEHMLLPGDTAAVPPEGYRLRLFIGYVLRVRYEVSGTELCVCCYQVCGSVQRRRTTAGTKLPYRPTRVQSDARYYATAYRLSVYECAMRCPVLGYRGLLCRVFRCYGPTGVLGGVRY
eukprot:2460776-Rhodomonas_salina.1